MADFYIDIDGNVTKNKGSKKKKKQSDFYIDINGNVTKTNDDDIAPVKESTEKRTWFEKGAFEDGYQFGDVFKTAVGTVRDVEQNLTAGILGIAEAVVDAGAYLVGGVGGLFGADEFKDKTKKFIADDLIDEKKAARAILGAKNPLYVLDPLSLDDSSALGDKTDSIVQSGGQLIGTIGLQAVGVPWFVTTGVTSFGKETESAFNEGASYGEAGISGLITAGAEILTEKISGGIKFGGSTLDDGLTKALATKISDKFTRTALKLGLDVVGEGAEEVLSEDISRFGQWLTYQDDKTLTEMLWSEEAMNEKIEAFIGGAMLGGAGSGINVARSSAVGRDATTGLTSNEEKVFKHVYESRVAEAEKNGETLSKSDKNKIYDEVMEELQKGAISTDTIEEALGGETYKTYKNTVESEDALLKEFDELGKKTSPTLADQSRYAELKEQIKGIKENSQRTQLKKQLGEEVFGLAKQGNDSYLLESYADTARRGQAFEADVKKYDAKQQKVIQAAIDSGILNNTRRTHEFVDMVAKISADKGVSFDFLNNEKLKNSGFAVDGKFVNGYLDKKTNTIGVNINSAKSLNTVVGHEISHVLEGTELYGEMQKAIFEYAKSKKDYDGRRKALESLYKAEDIDSELTADLVGDYLFSDPDFVKQLSVNNRNLFQKIYDEIKYLLKVVTAGSKEEKELLKVKKAFEDAYRADSKTEAKGEKAYSLSEYSDHQKKNWESSKRIVVYENGEQFSQFIQDSIDNKIIDKKMYFGAISADLASRIQADTGLDVENYNLSLGSFEIRKILKDHGSEETEAPRGQRAITPDDFSHIVDIVLNPTSIELSENTYMGKPAIEFTGNYNGRMNVVAVVSDKRLDLFVQTIYANIKKENLSTPIGEQAPINTPEANNGTVFSEDIVPQKEGNVNTQFSLSSDTNGKQLSEGQKEYFKDSKVVDENGNLKVMYHGTSKGAKTTERLIKRSELHRNKMDGIKAKFAKNGLDLDEVLKKAKDLSTFSTVDNTPQRVMEKSLGYKEGQILADETVNKVAQNETEGIKWLNSFTDRKSGMLKKISDRYHIKPGSKESAAAQMYAEGFYVDDNNNLIKYGDAELAKDFPDAKVQNNIKALARDPRIRRIYDDTLKAINESRVRNGYPEIQRLDNYFLHFRAMNDTFSRLGLPFNPNDIRAKDLPTDLNGVTADLKPGQPYFASAMHRRGQRTSFDLLGGLERYLSSAKNQIYHIDDIQTLRALRNYIADMYGQAKGLEGLDALSEEEVQERIEKVHESHLSTFAKFLNEEANILAGKTTLIDRGLEGIVGRRAMTFMDTLNRQVGSNMVGYNVSSALTNLIAPVQAFAKMNKTAFVKGFAQTVSNRVKSISGKGDGFADASPVMIRRKGADRFHRTAWQKISDPGYALMGAVDNFSTELIARAKYNELTAKGMASDKAHLEADKWVSRLMGDRSLGQMPQLYNSKMLGLITKFQLEVRNQLDSQFYDTIKEAGASTEDIKNASERNAKKAAKIASTFATLAIGQHLFGKVFESIAGYNPAFDIISVLIKTLGLDDDEESEDTFSDNFGQALYELAEDMPYSSFFLDGGRVPMANALPDVGQILQGEDDYGNKIGFFPSLGESLTEIAPYYFMPGGYGQVKKTMQGLSMFDEDHPIAGSYTDSGNLRFPVEDTLGNRIQAGIFGQWASENARDYFDNGRKPLNEKQTQEFIDSDMPIRDYWEYREGLSGLSSLNEKADYIAGLDLPIDTKNLLLNNIANRKNDIDLTSYDEYGNFEEFDFAQDRKELYRFLKSNGISFGKYLSSNKATKEAYAWASKNPGKYTLSKAISNNLVVYRQYAKDIYDIEADKDENGDSIRGSKKEKVIEYINNLDAEYGEKIILFKSAYKADNTYNYEIIDYLNGRDDLSYEDVEAILKELGFKVDSEGNISW